MTAPGPAVATFYRFVALDDLEAWQRTLQVDASHAALKGTILLAAEGINGTLVGHLDALRGFMDDLLRRPEFADMPVKYSSASQDNRVFHRLKVRIKAEIVAMGRADVDVSAGTGQHVSPAQWNNLLRDPDVPVLDVRNHYETQIGTFRDAVDPQTRSFREFPDYVAQHLDPARHPRVAMFCTGGIRCEKASSFLLQQGFEEVYQLDGGILNYLAQVEEADNLFDGECFVFDQRVSVTAELDEGSYVQCFACRRPLKPEDTASPDYRQGQCCPYCVHELSPQQRDAFAERQRQVELAQERGEDHIGAAYSNAATAVQRSSDNG